MANPDNQVLREEIARRAYLRFCDRGCLHGGDVDDWIAAEGEVLTERPNDAAIEASSHTLRPSRETRKKQR